MADQYVDKDDVKNRIGLSGSGQDDNIDNAINGASRQIDAICGRYFYQDATARVQYYSVTNDYFLITDDISTTTGLIVELDTTDDGTYDKTLTLETDFTLKPYNPKINRITDGTTYYWPYNEIEILATRSSERFDRLIQKNVKVTAKFGWSSIPDAVKEATLIQATRLWKRKDTPFNVYGNEQTGTIELFNKMDPDAKELIKGYIKRKL